MMHFRFWHKRMGYFRWRCRAARRRALFLAARAQAAAGRMPGVAGRRRRRAAAATPPAATALRVGEYLVSAEGDPQLLGHPGIRY